MGYRRLFYLTCDYHDDNRGQCDRRSLNGALTKGGAEARAIDLEHWSTSTIGGRVRHWCPDHHPAETGAAA